MGTLQLNPEIIKAALPEPLKLVPDRAAFLSYISITIGEITFLSSILFIVKLLHESNSP